MSQIKIVTNQFATLYNGEPWYGNSIARILENIPEESAFWKPTEGAHAIAQIVWHMIYWRQSLVKKTGK